MNQIRTAVVGASGYSGEELIRLLLRHPDATLSCITSRSYAGQPVGEVFPRFAESALHFSASDTSAIADSADVAFLALPHGLAADFAAPLLEKGVRVIDISADFRLRDAALYRTFYDMDHPAPEWLLEAVYGLPERRRDAIRNAKLIACPGCYPTSVLLPLLPLLAAGLVTAPLTSFSMSGVTGAGRKVDLPFIFPECNESARPYKVTGHRHIPEMEQELSIAAGRPVALSFIPHLIPVSRGIHSTITAAPADGVGAAEIREAWTAAYDNAPFVRVLAEGKLADTKHVTMSNVCEIGVALNEATGTVILSSAIDNLTKGASGQAVQCMNVMCGFDETAGLL